MIEKDFRESIVNEALEWLGTPYHHHAGIKRVGVDCAMILIEVYAEAKVIKRFDPRPYAIDWHLHNSEELYLEQISPYAKEISVDEVKKGDFCLCKMGRTFSHSAIILDYPLAIHAYIKDNIVEYTDLTKEPWKGREIKLFTLWDKK